MTEGRLSLPDGENIYLKVKNAFQLSSQQLAYLKVLAKWRLSKAVSRNLALGFVIKDHALIALAKKQPTTLAELNSLNDLTDQEKRIHGKDLLAVMATADLINLPEVVDIVALKAGYKSAFKEIKSILSGLCESKDVALEFVGSKRLIHEFLLWLYHNKQTQTPLLLSGWRGQLVGDSLAGVHFN